MKYANNYKNMVGFRTGMLEVVSGPYPKQLENGKRCHLWHVKCNCGQTMTMATSRLSIVKSCFNCSRRRGPESPLFNGGGLKALYRKQKTRAIKDRNLKFTLTFKKFAELLKEPCFYCKLPPALVVRGESILINTIDRFDPSVGYKIGNVVPCCKECNLRKGIAHGSDFLKWIDRLLKNIRSLG